MKKRWYFSLLLLLLLSGKSFAFDYMRIQPVSPNGVFSTFSAESIPQKSASIEIGAERSKEPNFYRFSLKGAYGITDNIELNVTVPYVYNYAGYADGIEDISFGFKHRFYNEGKYGPSLAYLLNASIANGRDEFSANGRVGLGLILSKRLGPFDGHINFFYERPGRGNLSDELSFSGGVEFSAAHNFKILSEVIAKRGNFSHKYDQLEARFGYRIKTTDYINTTIGVGADFKKRSPEYRVMLSVSFTTPEEKKEIRKIIEVE